MRFYFSLFFITAIFLSSINAYSEEKVNFKDEETARKLLFDKEWFCSLGDPMYSGYSTWKFEEINGKKVTGTIYREYCGKGHNSGTQGGAPVPDTFKGKLKKDTFKFSVPANGPKCTAFSGRMEFFFLDDTDLQSQGKYTRVSSGSETFRGTMFCYVKNK